MNMHSSAFRFGLLFPLVAALLGCSGDHPGAPLAEPYAVQGQISFADRTPLRGGVIYFTPTEARDGRYIRYEAAALVDAKGHYILGFNGDNTGAPAGDYTVTIMPRDYLELPKSNSNRIPQKYQDKASTPLQVKVLEKENTFDFVLQ
jgi:hypothetical protein